MKISSFLISCLLAFLAGHMVNYSIIFLALEWFNSHQLAGIGYALCFGPPIVLGWVAGVYCDRYSPRKVILVAQNSYFISLIILYFAFDLSAFAQIISLLTAAFFVGVGWSFVAPARFTALPFYVSKEKLVVATIALNLMVMTGFGLAPMLLKLINSSYSWSGVFFVTTLFLILSSLILLPLTFEFSAKPVDKAKTEIIESLSYIKNSKVIAQLLMLAGIAYLLMGPMQVLLPSVAKDSLNLSEIAQGNYLSLVAFSLIAGGLIAMAIKSKFSFGPLIFLAIAFAATGIGLLGVISNLSPSVITLVLASISGGVAISLIVAGLQYFSPDHLRGRIMAVYTITGQFIPAVSGLAAGVFAGKWSYNVALIIFACIILVGLLTSLFVAKEIRKTISLT